MREETRVVVHVCCPRLIQNIVANDVRVSRESGRNLCPEGKHLIKETVFIRIQGSKSRCNLWSCVHLHEVLSLALRSERETVGIRLEAVALNTDTLASQVESLSQDCLGACVVKVFRRVEPWHALTT